MNNYGNYYLQHSQSVSTWLNTGETVEIKTANDYRKTKELVITYPNGEEALELYLSDDDFMRLADLFICLAEQVKAEVSKEVE
jgi:ABC-type ATPase with predicted acetyltransferase domain